MRVLHKTGKGVRPQTAAVFGALMRGAVVLPRWLFWVALIVTPFRAMAESNDDAEYRLKLAFLYNFTQFVQWPPEAFPSQGSAMTICVEGDDPFRGAIGQELQGRTAGGHAIQIRHLKPDEDPRVCQVLFIRSRERKTAEKIFPLLRGSSTLTVGESSGFAAQGGVVNFTLDENKLRFEINLDAARQTRLKISSKLLALAKIVKDDHGH